VRRRENQYSIAYLNFAFVWGKSLLAILIIMFCFISVKSISPIKPPSQIEIILTWDDNSQDDVDLWVNPPNNKPVYFANRDSENGLITLDRDDLGINDEAVINGQEVKAAFRSEVVSIRGNVVGHYSVVANLYDYREVSGLSVGSVLPKPIHVKIQIVQLDPTNGIVYSSTKVITLNNQELFLVSFDLNSDKSISGIDDVNPVDVMGLTSRTSDYVSDNFQ
jgi:hypothetical protein